MKKTLSHLLIAGILLFFSCKQKTENNVAEISEKLTLKDCHVHIMSPNLIKDWKDLGIPFSKADYIYSDIDSILKTNGAGKINLIGMGYIYGNPEFYQGKDEYLRLKQENDFLFQSAKKHEDRVKPFFAIDPLKNYAIDEIQRCIKINEKSGLKLHFSSSQVYLTEPEQLQKIKSVFEIASENKLPILLHFDNWHPKFGRPDIELLVDEILKDIEQIELTIAHFGTSGGFNQKTKKVLNTFIEFYETDRIPKMHKIKFDISAVALNKDSEGVEKLTDEEFKELKIYCDKLGYDKIVFGTDYPLYNSEQYYNILSEKLNLTKSELKQISE